MTEFPEVIQWFAEGKLNPRPLVTGTIALGYSETDDFDTAFKKEVDAGIKPNGKPTAMMLKAIFRSALNRLQK